MSELLLAIFCDTDDFCIEYEKYCKIFVFWVLFESRDFYFKYGFFRHAI